MTHRTPAPAGERRPLAAVALIAVCLPLALYLLQKDILLGLMDEGFLWYGAWRTSLGELPIRDFESYDPGRYHWSGLFLWAFGNSSDVLRLSLAAFQAVGLAFGLLVLRRISDRWWFLLASGSVLALWMFPRHKVFEATIVLAAVWFAVRLLEQPSLRRHFAAGVFVGIAAWFGRNHGLYNLVAFALLYGFALWKIDGSKPLAKMLWAGLGIAAGYLPMIVAIVLAPGFAEAFLHGITEVVRLSTTNVVKDIPWPWTVWRESVDTVGVVVTLRSTRFLLGVILVVYPLLVAAALLFLAVRRPPFGTPLRLIAAVSAVGFAYLHYPLSRADLEHVALVIAPLLIGSLALPTVLGGPRWFRGATAAAVAAALLVVTWYTVGRASYLYRKVHLQDLQTVQVTGNAILVQADTAEVLRALDEIRDHLLAPDDAVVVLPFWPTAYVVLERPAPIWDIYMHFERSEERQREIVARLDAQGVRWALVGDMALDGDDAWRMKNRNPILWAYFTGDAFEKVEVAGLPANYRLLRRR